MPLNGSAVWAVDQQVMSRRIGDEQVILHVERGIYFGLDEVGTRIWELIEDQASIDAIAVSLATEYEVSLEQAGADATRLVEELLANGLIREAANG